VALHHYPRERNGAELPKTRRDTETARRPTPQPGETWTREAAASFVARYDAEVSEAMARLREQLESAHPSGSDFVYRYTADTITRYRSTRCGMNGQAMGYVEVRMPTGETYSGTVSVRWEDGSVIITENPAVPA
jgi:hypothetical protein